jgi:transaldolase
MSAALHSLIQTGTRLWLDSVDPELVIESRAQGASGATSNPIIIADLIKSGRFDEGLRQRAREGWDDPAIAWAMTDEIVAAAQRVFLDIWQSTHGNDGYVSFELDPLLEDPQTGPSHEERVAEYLASAIRWNEGQSNRLIKVPATPAGIDALEPIVAAGINPNVTLVFSERQYVAARDAVWRGARKRASLQNFKSCYSIFVSRIDVYTEKHCPSLSTATQGLVGIVNAQRIRNLNRQFWASRNCPLQQEIIFASTGTKKSSDPPWKYVAALAGSDIQTNPPATNAAVAASDIHFERLVDRLPDASLISEIDRIVDFAHLEDTLMEEGIAKFADPQRALLELIARKRESLVNA